MKALKELLTLAAFLAALYALNLLAYAMLGAGN